MRVAIYHNLPDGGAIRALHELVKHSYEEVDYDLYQLFPANDASRYNFRPYVKKYKSYDFSYDPSRLDMFIEIVTRFAKLRRIQKNIADEIDSKKYDAVFVHHCAIAQTPFLMQYLKTKNLYFIQEPRRLSFEQDFYNKSKEMIPKALQAPWIIRQKILKDLDVANARKCSAALCNSKYAQGNITKAYGIDAEVCYLGIDQERFFYAKSTKKNQIVVVGTLHPAKGQDLAIRALSKVKAMHGVRLVFVYENYDTRYKQELEVLSKKLGMIIEFRQGVTDGQLAKIYRESIVTLAVATKEPFGFTPIESAACGTPTVAVNEGGYLETVNQGVNGLLCEREVDPLARAIDEAIQTEWSPSKMSKEARAHWSWQASAKTYLTVLRSLIDG
ncbi:glycosyltransferase family 4 protein [bacterium]|nr:MAG: glycosyltransferase family 4 protein [bacterium]